MRKVALRGLLAHKLRLIMTVGAVALGVAFIGGTLVFTDTMQRSFDDLFATVYEGTDAVVRSEESIDGEFGDNMRGTVTTELRDQVGALPSVEAAIGEVESFAQIIDRDGNVAAKGLFGSPTILVSIEPELAERPDLTDRFSYGLADDQSRWPLSGDEVVLNRAAVESTGYEYGDRIPLQTQGGRKEYTLVGSVRFGTSDTAAGSSLAVLTVEEAQRVVGEPDRFNSITVLATEGTSQEAVTADIAAMLPDGTEVLTGDEITKETQSDVREGLSFFTIIFLVFAFVAVVVGSFVIYNSFSIIVAQRAREMALLRALGATRRQVRRSVFIEALFTGLIGSAIGLAIGVGLASVLRGFLDIDASLLVQPGSLVIALVVGLLVTVLSAVWPAWRASRVPPVAAMRDMAIDTTGRSLIRLVLGALLLVVGVVLSVSGARGGNVARVGVGVALAFVGVFLAAPGLARPVGLAFGWPLARFRGVSGQLARQNAVRNPRRTAATSLALTIGVGIVAFFLVLNASIRSSFDKILDDSFAGDFVVDTESFGLIGLPEEVGQRLAEQPEVGSVVPIRWSLATVDDSTTSVTGTSPGLFDMFGADVTGSGDLSLGTLVIKEGTKVDGEELAIGDPVTLDLVDAEPVTLTVGGIYDIGPGMDMGNYIIGVEQYGELVANPSDAQVTVALADGVDHEDGRLAVQSVVDEVFPTANVQDQEDLKKTMGSMLDIMLYIVLGLLFMTIVIAGFGILNTIGLSVIERTREVGLLRAVGATRTQLRAAIRWESLIIALFGAALGMAVGTLGGWGLVTSLADEGFEVFTLPLGMLVVLAVLAGILGVLAALLPAWQASRLDVLKAIHTE